MASPSRNPLKALAQATAQAFRSFLFVPPTVTSNGSHVRDANDLKRVMIVVVVALLPCLFFGMYNVGVQHIGPGAFLPTFWYGFLKVLPLLIVSYAVGLGIEFTVAGLRGHEVNEGYLVTGLLIPLIVPVTTPLWMLALATAFAVIFGKEIFGGTGMNIWNPALLARAFLFFSYPASLTGDHVWVDGISAATPLTLTGTSAQYSLSELFIGLVPGCIGETSTLCILLGAALLLLTGVASWRIMTACLAGSALLCVLTGLPLWEQWLMGGFAFGCVFMATDPVTSAQTEPGQWIYGFLIGALAMILRRYNPGYIEGMMLAILLLNTFAPLIDHLVIAVHKRRHIARV